MNMNVNKCMSAVNAYMYNSSDITPKKTSSASSVRNRDTVEFSKAAKAVATEGITGYTKSARAAAAKAADASASPERLAALKNAIASGSYNIPSGDIAASILGA